MKSLLIHLIVLLVFSVGAAKNPEFFGIPFEIKLGNISVDVEFEKKIENNKFYKITPQQKFPFKGTIAIKNNEESGHVSLEVDGSFTDSCSFSEELKLFFKLPSDSAYIGNYGYLSQKVVDSSRVRNLENYARVYSDGNTVGFYVRNITHANWEKENDGLSLVVIQTLMPYGKNGYKTQEGPIIGSTFKSGQKINRIIEVYKNKDLQIPLSFSEHPNGYSQTLTMYWDELPNRDKWNFMTTEDATDVKYDHYWIRLLNENKKRKMGYLLLPDRILFRRRSYFEGWQSYGMLVFPDSLEKTDGEWSLCLENNNVDSTYTVWQDIKCEPECEYTLSYKLKTQEVNGVGAYAEVYGYPEEHLIKSGEHVTGSNAWSEYTINFKTSEDDTLLRIYGRMQNSTGRAFFDEMVLSKKSDGINIIENGGFEKNSPAFCYENERRHWVDVHGPEWIVKAPEKYLKFLRRIETDSLKYGWEDQVNIGCHGYHHTPTIFKPDNCVPGWEFQEFDSLGDSLRLDAVIRDFKSIGLTYKSFRYWRSPGLKYTNSLVSQLVKNDFVFMDNCKSKEDFSAVLVQSGKKKMWTLSQAWWADVAVNKTMDKTHDYLRRGHIAQWGGHPEEVFKDAKESTYNRLAGILSDIEREFPNLGYLFPDEYADNLNAISELSLQDVQFENGDLTFCVNGEIKKGITLVFSGDVQNAKLDNVPLKITKDGQKTFISFTKDVEGDFHRIKCTGVKPVSVKVKNVVGSDSPRLFSQNGFLIIKSLEKGPKKLCLYSLSGKVVATYDLSSVKGVHKVDVSSLSASGIYVASLVYGNKLLNKKIMLY